MNILFITASRIGDAVLSTGLLDHIAQTHPTAKVTIVCSPLTSSLFQGYPNLERVIALTKKKHHKHWIDLWKGVAGTHWDMVVDLRNSAVSRLIRAKVRHIYGRRVDRNAHKVQQNAAVMDLGSAPSPRLWFTDEQKAAARAFIPDGAPVLGVGPTANWLAKTWPVERFIDVIGTMIADDGAMPGARVAVFSAPGEEAPARAVLSTIPEAQRIDVIAKTDPGTAAATLSLCGFYIGNDSGLMHCAAATGIPVLGLFGPSYPHLYQPWGAKADYISTPESFGALIDYEGYSPDNAPCLMETLSVEMVMDQIRKCFD